MPVLAARGALNDPSGFFILDRERDRHVWQQERLIDNQYRQQDVRRFPRSPLLRASATSDTGFDGRRRRV